VRSCSKAGLQMERQERKFNLDFSIKTSSSSYASSAFAGLLTDHLWVFCSCFQNLKLNYM
jgi:hypothetical protein